MGGGLRNPRAELRGPARGVGGRRLAVVVGAVREEVAEGGQEDDAAQQPVQADCLVERQHTAQPRLPAPSSAPKCVAAHGPGKQWIAI